MLGSEVSGRGRAAVCKLLLEMQKYFLLSDYVVYNMSMSLTLPWSLLFSLSLSLTLTYSYERTIIDLDRSAQRNNPELVVCTKQSRLRKQVAQLRFITRELNILSGVQPCSSDDEDCVDTVPHTCNYFQFPDSYEYANVSEHIEDPGSGSGSGSENETFENEDEDVCAEGFVGGGVTPTIIIGPDTTDKTTDTIDTTDVTNVGSNETRIGDSGAARLSSTSFLALVFVVAVSMFVTSSSRWYL